MEVVPVIKLQDRETLARGSGKGGGRKRNNRRGWLLQVLSLLLAFALSGFVLFFGWGMKEEPDTVEAVVSSTMADSPAAEAVPGFDAEALGDQLEEIAREHTGVYGVAVLEPDSGTKISLRGDEEFGAASIGKLPTFATLYRAAARGELDLEEEISILPQDIQDYGSGVLHAFPPGYSLSLRECAYYLVNSSDNTAWAMLDRRLGAGRISNELEEMGIKSFRYPGDLSTYYTTPNDVLLLLEKISDPHYTSDELSKEMLDDMTETAFEDRIPEKLPRDAQIAHKTGSYEDNFGDAGVVSYKDSQGVERRYYLVVLARNTGEYEARDVIQSMSLAVYEALTGVKVDPGWSRGKSVDLGSVIGDQPGPVVVPAEDTERDQKNAEPAKPPLDEGLWPALQNPPPNEKWPSGTRNNAAPDPSFVPTPSQSLNGQQPVESGKAAPTFSQTFEQEEEETEFW